MHWPSLRWKTTLIRLRALLFRRAMDEELDEELKFHLEMQTRKNVACGLPLNEAKRQARLQFGGLESATEGCREARGVNFLETLGRDVRYALRGWRRSPMFACTVVAIIAVGLGINTASFTIFDAYVLRPAAVRDPHSLFRLHWIDRKGGYGSFTWREYEALRKEQAALSDAVAQRFVMARVDNQPMYGLLVTGNFFETLGVGAHHGRTLIPADSASPGASPVLVLSYQAWQHRFGGDPSIIGRKLLIRGYPFEVVGITKLDFTGLGDLPFDFWAPITMVDQLEDGPSLFNTDSLKTVSVIGRIPARLGRRQAEATLTPWVERMTAERPEQERAAAVSLVPAATPMPWTPEVLAIFTPVLIAFGLVLLIACANVANLMIARAMSRQREIGTRLSLGASRSRLVGQLLTESIILAFPSAAAGLLISQLTIDFGQKLMFATLPADFSNLVRVIPLHADVRVFAFMVIAAIAAAVFFGLAPAIQVTRVNVLQACKGEFTTDHRPARLRNALVIGQLTVCVFLLSCAMLLLRTAGAMSKIDPRVRTSGVLAMEFPAKYAGGLAAALRAHPLVETVAAARSIPLNGPPSSLAIKVLDSGKSRSVWYNMVSPDFFTILRIPILRGRTFTREETEAQAAVAIVSSATAEKLWPDQDPIGHVIRIAGDEAGQAALMRRYDNARVIGVAADIDTTSIAWGQDPTMLYLPTPGALAKQGTQLASTGTSLLILVRGDDHHALETLDASLAVSSPGAVLQLHRLQDFWAGEVYPFRVAGWVATLLAGLALWLTVSGIYGVPSYLVAQRRKEIGIRLALGASGRAVAALVVKQSMRLAAAGIAAGAAMAMVAAQVLVPRLQIPSMGGAFDGASYLFAILVALLAAAGAAYVPARRAVSVDPVEVLRYD